MKTRKSIKLLKHNLIQSETPVQYSKNLLIISETLARRVVGMSIFNSYNYFQDATWQKLLRRHSDDNLAIKHKFLSPISLPKLFSISLEIRHTGYNAIIDRSDAILVNIVVVSIERYKLVDTALIDNGCLETFHPFIQQQNLIAANGTLEDVLPRLDNRIIAYENSEETEGE